MTALWTYKDAKRATNGRAIGTWSAGALSIDTRSIEPGQLFVALKDIRDGHDFIPMAYEKGAAAVISERDIADTPALIVENTLSAMQDLARFAKNRSNAKRIAITGSVGKTSVKEMIATICRTVGNTHASIKSFNNHWGVPLTMANMPPSTKYGVFETGMNHTGELEHLSNIVRPHIAVLTKIAPAHMAHFNSLEDIAAAKAEIFSHLEKDGIAIIPNSALQYKAIAKLAESKNVLTFGENANDNLRIVSSEITPSGSKVVYEFEGERIKAEIPLVGAHWVENMAAALLCAKTLGISFKQAIKALQKQENIKGRGQIHKLSIDGKSIILIDESYNANPESMRAAIAALGLYQGRKIAVLGDMLELGPDAAELHAGLAQPLREHDIDLVLTCGSLMQALDKSLPVERNGGHEMENGFCLDRLIGLIKDGDVIMVKGSNASGMGQLVEHLKNQSDIREQERGLAHVL